MSWLSRLPRHPIFELPLDRASDSPSPSFTSLGAASTSTSSRHRRQPSEEFSGVSQSDSARSLFGAKATPTRPPFADASPRRSTSTPNARSSSSRRTNLATDKSTSRHAEKERLLPREKRNERIVVVRGTDLVVAVGRELRIANLGQVKARALGGLREERDDDDEIDIGEYKVLDTPSITFEIHQLVVNPTSKLVAVVGAHSVCVVDLPRKGWTNSVSGTIECRCLPVGKFYHHLPGSPAVAQALWHPLGQNASSLVVLTSDSILREYTIDESVEEPSQTLSFVASRDAVSMTGSRGPLSKGFSADDDDEETAVGMCVGGGERGWGKLTLWGLMKSGDVVALSPFLPKRASIPRTYLESLTSFVSTKLDSVSSSSTSLAPFTPTRLSSSSSLALARSTDAAQTTELDRSTRLAKRYATQLQFLHSMTRQISHAAREDDQEGGSESNVSVTAPTGRPGFRPMLQGPFLMQPGSADLDNGLDSSATDIVHLTTRSSEQGPGRGFEEADDEAGQGLGVVLVSYSDGKLEVCLEVEKVEARFEGERATAATPIRRVAGKGYGVGAFDDDDDDAEQDADEDLPSLFVYETIDLGFSELLAGSKDSRNDRGLGAKVWPVMRKDPLYPHDTVYIHHELGVQGFVLGRGIEEMWNAVRGVEVEEGAVEKAARSALADEGDEDRSRAVWIVKTHSAAPTRNTPQSDEETSTDPPIVGLSVVHDVYLGYSLLAITPFLQLVALELSLRIDPELLPSSDVTAPASILSTSTHTPPSATKNAVQQKAYVSLLDTPFTVPTVFQKLGSQRPRLAGLILAGAGGEAKVTPEALRQLGKHVETYQSSIRDLAEGVDTVQRRLELQMKELSRQLDKIKELQRVTGDLRASTSAASSARGDVGGSTLVGRMAHVEANQVRLLERLDRVLQNLMIRHQGSDQVSTFERKWFDELARLERQVRTASGGGGLEGRAKRIEAMWDELRDDVEEMAERKKRKGDEARSGDGVGGLGQGQVRNLEAKLAQESKLLSDAKKKVERLTHALASASL